MLTWFELVKLEQKLKKAAKVYLLEVYKYDS